MARRPARVVEEVPISREKVCTLGIKIRRSAGAVELARLESVYTSKGYQGFESLLLRMIKEKFYVYILQSLKDFSFYVGQCDDLDYRMSKHADGMSKYTSSKRPLRLVYFETFNSRSDAIITEKEIKKMKSRIYIEQLISNWKKNYCSSV
jgi:putative endonuclease